MLPREERLSVKQQRGPGKRKPRMGNLLLMDSSSMEEIPLLRSTPTLNQLRGPRPSLHLLFLLVVAFIQNAAIAMRGLSKLHKLKSALSKMMFMMICQLSNPMSSLTKLRDRKYQTRDSRSKNPLLLIQTMTTLKIKLVQVIQVTSC